MRGSRKLANVADHAVDWGTFTGVQLDHDGLLDTDNSFLHLICTKSSRVHSLDHGWMDGVDGTSPFQPAAWRPSLGRSSFRGSRQNHLRMRHESRCEQEGKGRFSCWEELGSVFQYSRLLGSDAFIWSL